MVCCVTGHRPKGFHFSRSMDDIAYNLYLDRLYSEIQNLICEGYKDFISGMADGADLDFANAVIYYRDKGEDVTLEAALPYPIAPRKTSSPYTEERDEVLSSCDKKHIVSPYYHNGCMQKRNQYMVDKSDLVLAIWNGSFSGGTWNTIKYAKRKGKPIRYITLNEIGNTVLKNN